MNVRTQALSQGVAVVQSLAIVAGRRDGDTGADGIAGTKQRPEVGAIGDPERSDDQMPPTTVLGPAALAPEVSCRCLRPAHAIVPDRLLSSRRAQSHLAEQTPTLLAHGREDIQTCFEPHGISSSVGCYRAYETRLRGEHADARSRELSSAQLSSN